MSRWVSPSIPSQKGELPHTDRTLIIDNLTLRRENSSFYGGKNERIGENIDVEEENIFVCSPLHLFFMGSRHVLHEEGTSENLFIL